MQWREGWFDRTRPNASLHIVKFVKHPVPVSGPVLSLVSGGLIPLYSLQYTLRTTRTGAMVHDPGTEIQDEDDNGLPNHRCKKSGPVFDVVANSFPTRRCTHVHRDFVGEG